MFWIQTRNGDYIPRGYDSSRFRKVLSKDALNSISTTDNKTMHRYTNQSAYRLDNGNTSKNKIFHRITSSVSITTSPVCIICFILSMNNRVTIDASTCTTLDGIIHPKQQQIKLAKGPDPKLRKGPEVRGCLRLKLDKGPDPSLRKGPAFSASGPKGCSVNRSKVVGADPWRRKGADGSLRLIKHVQELSWDE